MECVFCGTEHNELNRCIPRQEAWVARIFSTKPPEIIRSGYHRWIFLEMSLILKYHCVLFRSAKKQMSVIDFWQRKKIREVILNDEPVNISSDSTDDDLELEPEGEVISVPAVTSSSLAIPPRKLALYFTSV